MSMTKYERAKVAEFYGEVVATLIFPKPRKKKSAAPVLAHRKRLIMMMCFIVYHMELEMSRTKGAEHE